MDWSVRQMHHLGRHCPLRVGIAIVLAFLARDISPARAQPADEDIAAAGRAFDEAQRAQLRRDYARAAELFELADRLAPSAPAMRSAIRNLEAAGNAARAATLASEATDRYPSDLETQRLATGTLARLAPTLASLLVRCTPACGLELDRRLVATAAAPQHHLFVVPGEHALVARFIGGSPAAREHGAGADRRSETRRLDAVAGDVIELALRAPPEDSPPPPAVVAASAPAPGRLQRWRRLAPAVARRGAARPLRLAGVLLWSGVDTLGARDRYVSHPTEAAYYDGLARERRTNGLIGAVAGLATITVAIGLVGTRWHRRQTASQVAQ
jgi:hypothetical protein